ncbi:hypothetical protein [Streptomyces lichenis]|uniref:Uncharacterized protein n=1 Tax=Streptomyces lichenis TaxID=2306967 RepID=A0ABT0IIC7_9ACTN|nr:hypothetical protein [Streptomyces lichenis]MCK8681083.1 hypothetical protein [Streptomyces lichenis]
MASAPQLAPGVTLVTAPGQGLAVRTADGAFLRVDTADTDPAALTAALTGHPYGDSGTPAPELTDLIAAFEQAGYAAPAPADHPGRLDGRTVHLLGDAALTEPLAALIREEGGTVRPTHPGELTAISGTGAAATAVVWCLDRPVPPGLWDDADRLPAHGTAWLRCHREGAQLWLEPFADRPGDVTSAHIRLRRLAATPAHRELAAYWAGHRSPEAAPPTTGAPAALAAALLAADLLAWAAADPGRGPLPVRRRLRRLDLRDLTVTEHPVLPVPDVAPLPKQPTR